MKISRDTRKDSRRAKRAHQKTQATQHGWTHSSLELRASIAEHLARQFEAAEDGLDDALFELRNAWLAANEAREAIG